MDPSGDYLDTLIELIKKVKNSQKEKFRQAAGILANAVKDGRLIYVWGPGGHSSIFAEDVMYRKGELANVCPIYDPNISLSHGAAREINGMERVAGFGKAIIEYHGIGMGDAVIIGSAYGVNPVAIQGTLECHERGAYVIAVTSPEFSDKSVYMGARHDNGKSLYQTADMFIDTFVPYGDAVLEYDIFERKISPVATIMQAIVLKALMAETMVLLKQMGVDPFTWTNSLQSGGIQANSMYMKEIWGKVKSM